MIYLECDPDKALVKALGISKTGIFHAGNKGNVCNRLKRNKNSKGLVDDDPSSAQPSYMDRLRLLSDEYGIKLLYDERNENHLIVLCPRLEDWILKAAKQVVGRGMGKKYGLPENADQLHKVINTNLEKFVNLVNDIKEKSGMLKALESLIKR